MMELSVLLDRLKMEHLLTQLEGRLRAGRQGRPRLSRVFGAGPGSGMARAAATRH